jgi:hypothetical protein
VKTKLGLALLLAVVVVVVIAIVRPPNQTAKPRPQEPEPQLSAAAPEPPRAPINEEGIPVTPPVLAPAAERTVLPPAAEKISTNKLERLKQIRETFVGLAAGEPTTALRAAKQLADETERETALLTLVTEWNHGELSPARRRAHAIDAFGLEAGLAFEIADRPELAVPWANELTQGAARVAVLQQTAINLVSSDPAAAFALSEQLGPAERRGFLDSLFAGWGGTDTEAAMKNADQLSDPAERDAAIQAIRTAAPVGIGAVLNTQDGYAVINQLLPGAPADLSGQIHPGDRIVGLAQGDNSFVDARNLPLEKVVQMVRGAPNSMLQLQLQAPGDPPDSVPRTVSILRDQVKFKK